MYTSEILGKSVLSYLNENFSKYFRIYSIFSGCPATSASASSPPSSSSSSGPPPSKKFRPYTRPSSKSQRHVPKALPQELGNLKVYSKLAKTIYFMSYIREPSLFTWRPQFTDKIPTICSIAHGLKRLFPSIDIVMPRGSNSFRY